MLTFYGRGNTTCLGHRGLSGTNLVFGGGKGRQTARSVSICNQEVEIVNISFKYLGILTVQNLTFCDNVDIVYEKAQQRLFLLRKMKSFEVYQRILEMVYRGLIGSLLSFVIVTWCGDITVKNKARLARTVHTVSKVILAVVRGSCPACIL